MPVTVTLQDVGTQFVGSLVVEALEGATQRVTRSVDLMAVRVRVAGRNGLTDLRVQRSRGLAQALVAQDLQQIGLQGFQFALHLLEHQRIAVAFAQGVCTRVGRNVELIRYTDCVGH